MDKTDHENRPRAHSLPIRIRQPEPSSDQHGDNTPATAQEIYTLMIHGTLNRPSILEKYQPAAGTKSPEPESDHNDSEDEESKSDISDSSHEEDDLPFSIDMDDRPHPAAPTISPKGQAVTSK